MSTTKTWKDIPQDKKLHIIALFILSIAVSIAWSLTIAIIIFVAGLLFHYNARNIFNFWQRTGIIAVFGIIINLCKESWDTGGWNRIYPWGPVPLPLIGELPFFAPKAIPTGWDWGDFWMGTFGLVMGLGLTMFIYYLVYVVKVKIVD